MSRSVFYKRRIVQDSDDEFEVEINKKAKKTLIETEEQVLIEEVLIEEVTNNEVQPEPEPE